MLSEKVVFIGQSACKRETKVQAGEIGEEEEGLLKLSANGVGSYVIADSDKL